MADESKFKHDVAFSFLAQDLTLTTKFADALAPLTSFVFARKQEDLAGTDGQESFRAAFRFDSRLNVVLLRAHWGQTPWTRVEEAAIQERCLKDGWEHLLVVNLDGSAPPKWIPAVNLYLDLQTFPFEQAVGAIKRQAQQLGSNVKAQSPADLARAKLQAADFGRETKDLFRTPLGIDLADNAVIRVGDQLYEQLQEIAEEGKRGWTLVIGRENSSYTVVRVQGCSVLINWQRYVNDCNDSELAVRVYTCPFVTPEEARAGKYFAQFGREENPAFNRSYKVTRHPTLGVAWNYGGKTFSSEDVASEALSRVIDVLTKTR
jgi:hypothetical protein